MWFGTFNIAEEGAKVYDSTSSYVGLMPSPTLKWPKDVHIHIPDEVAKRLS